MRKILLLLAIFTSSILASGGKLLQFKDEIAKINPKETYVFICDSNTAYAYHSTTSCRGLNRCTHKILKVTLADAVKVYKRKPCKICEGN